MKRLLISTCTVFLLVTSALIAAGPGPNSIIALDWHGTHLYVLTPTTVTMYDAAGRIRLATTKLPSGFRAAGIVTRRLGDHEHVFVSGFYGREGMIYDYETITTAPPDHYAT